MRLFVIKELRTASTHQYHVVNDVINFISKARNFSSIDLTGFMLGSPITNYGLDDIPLMERTIDLLMENWPEYLSREQPNPAELLARIAEVRNEQKVV